MVYHYSGYVGNGNWSYTCMVYHYSGYVGNGNWSDNLWYMYMYIIIQVMSVMGTFMDALINIKYDIYVAYHFYLLTILVCRLNVGSV